MPLVWRNYYMLDKDKTSPSRSAASTTASATTRTRWYYENSTANIEHPSVPRMGLCYYSIGKLEARSTFNSSLRSRRLRARSWEEKVRHSSPRPPPASRQRGRGRRPPPAAPPAPAGAGAASAVPLPPPAEGDATPGRRGGFSVASVERPPPPPSPRPARAARAPAPFATDGGAAGGTRAEAGPTPRSRHPVVHTPTRARLPRPNTRAHTRTDRNAARRVCAVISPQRP